MEEPGSTATRRDKIVYHSRLGSQAAPVAAAIHLGILPDDREPRVQEILSVPYFAGLGRTDCGFLHFCGRDREGREVYVAGDDGHPEVVMRVVLAAAELAGQDPRRYVFVDCARAAGFLSAACNHLWYVFRGPGKGGRLLAWTIARRFRRMVVLVRENKDRIAR